MTDLELVNFLLSIPNIHSYSLHNLGKDTSIWASEHNKNIPVISAMYEKMVHGVDSNGNQYSTLQTLELIPVEYHEQLINLLYPLIEPEFSEDKVLGIQYRFTLTIPQLKQIKRCLFIDSIV